MRALKSDGLACAFACAVPGLLSQAAVAAEAPLQPGTHACVQWAAAPGASTRWARKFHGILQACAADAGPPSGALPIAAPDRPEEAAPGLAPQQAPRPDARPGWGRPIAIDPLPAGPPAAAAPDASNPPAEAGPRPVPRAGSVGARAVALAPLVDATARRHDIDPLLLHAIAYVESRHRSQARSPAGARGLMQVMPQTAERFGVDDARHLQQAATSLEVGAGYLKWLQRRFHNDLRLVLAAYNAGEGAVERHGHQVPPYPETQAYVRAVLAEYARLRMAAVRAPAAGPVLQGML